MRTSLTFLKNNFLVPCLFLTLCSCENNSKKTEAVKQDTTLVLSPDSNASAGNKSIPETADDKEPMFAFTKEDTGLLMLPDSIPFGLSYRKLKEKFPSLKKLASEGGLNTLPLGPLTETSANIRLMNKNVQLEFNFRNDSLYSYFFTLEETDFEKAGMYYNSIRNFYNKKFGECRQEKVEEENRYTESCYWPGKEYQTSISNNINESSISWGFQGK